MATQYNHSAIEKKWRENWEKHPINVNDGKKEKYYCLDMFPYPSGSGLHVGHWRGYVISDVWSRYQLLKGKYVIHPMGWDAFGLPAENYAIKMGVHPAKSTATNVANIKKQIKQIAAIYDWDMEVNTTDPEFYKWTQWIFVQMFKNVFRHLDSPDPSTPLTMFIFIIFSFLGPHLQDMEVPWLRVQLELQLQAFLTATATPDLSHIFDLSCSSWKC